ncbi:MAG: hypothetical protein JWQ19_914 [Subtercola sp.]|nr:hypothetical protein [Subtercola sp.]
MNFNFRRRNEEKCRNLIMVVTLGTVLSLIALYLPISYVLLGLPATDAPVKTDVIFVIGPVTPTRMAIAEQMLDEGVSDNLAISESGPFNSILAMCNGHYAYTVYCQKPDPFTTQGEARYLRDLTAAHGWRSATIITSTLHVTRSRILMSRCFTGTLSMVADTTPLSIKQWLYQYAYQSAAFAKVLVDESC